MYIYIHEFFYPADEYNINPLGVSLLSVSSNFKVLTVNTKVQALAYFTNKKK